jgi:uncharacterized protein DUF4160
MLRGARLPEPPVASRQSIDEELLRAPHHTSIAFLPRPHFHASHPDGSAKIRIDTLEVIDSNLGRRQLRFVLAWAELHQDELSEN